MINQVGNSWTPSQYQLQQNPDSKQAQIHRPKQLAKLMRVGYKYPKKKREKNVLDGVYGSDFHLDFHSIPQSRFLSLILVNPALYFRPLHFISNFNFVHLRPSVRFRLFTISEITFLNPSSQLLKFQFQIPRQLLPFH